MFGLRLSLALEFFRSTPPKVQVNYFVLGIKILIEMEEKLIKLWEDINEKRQLIISHMHNDSLKPELSVIYNKLISLHANNLCDIMDEIHKILNVETKKE